MGDLEKRKRIIQRLRPIDDIFFQKLMEDPPVCEESLRVIVENVGDPSLTVESVIPQKSVRNLRRPSRPSRFRQLGPQKDEMLLPQGAGLPNLAPLGQI